MARRLLALHRGRFACSAAVILIACTSAAERRAEISFCVERIPDRVFETNYRSDYERILTECLSGRFNWKLTAINDSKEVQHYVDELVRLANREKAEKRARADSVQQAEVAQAAKARRGLAGARVDSLTRWWTCELSHVRGNSMGETVWENLTTDCYTLYPSNGDSIFYQYINPQTFSDPAKIEYLQRQSRKARR